MLLIPRVIGAEGKPPMQEKAKHLKELVIAKSGWPLDVRATQVGEDAPVPYHSQREAIKLNHDFL
jgi:hypothetical protein